MGEEQYIEVKTGEEDIVPEFGMKLYRYAMVTVSPAPDVVDERMELYVASIQPDSFKVYYGDNGIYPERVISLAGTKKVRDEDFDRWLFPMCKDLAFRVN